MDLDKQRELIMDMEEDGSSNCCGAKVYLDICSGCKEHCSIITDEE